MSRFAEDILDDIEALPTGDIEGDHVFLDRYTLETLKLCYDIIEGEWGENSNTLLLTRLIKKWESLKEEFFYA